MSKSPITWLGMYEHPRQRAANDALWRMIADALRADGLEDVPERLARELSPEAAWGHPVLLLGQICIRPLRERFASLRVLGHPSYAICEQPARHRALLMCRADASARYLAELRGCRVAINDTGSNTGYRLVETLTGPLDRWTGDVLETGSHRESVRALARGRADLAGIDEVTFAAIARYDLALAKAVRVIERSPLVPTPPFVTAADTAPSAFASLRRVLDQVLTRAASIPELAPLGISGFRPVDLKDRCAIQQMRVAQVEPA